MFLAQNTVAQLSTYLLSGLKEIFDEREARNIHDELFRHYFGLNRADVHLKRHARLSESELLHIHHAFKRLKAGEPLQYITGQVHFYGMELVVNSAVLIPRPETEELISWLINLVAHPDTSPINCGHEGTHLAPRPLSILDIGTGSGCIALALKKSFPHAEVHACDISKEALDVAKRNSTANNLEIIFHHLDVLNEFPVGTFDLIISNPPYVLESEISVMQKQVTEYEPHLALFVPDNDPMLFYKRIISLSKTCLKPGGVLVFETHERWNVGVLNLLAQDGFRELKVFMDMQGKTRGVISGAHL